MNVIFTYKGKQYEGEFLRVQGGGDTGIYHLMIDKYYRGCLRLSAFNNQWVFDGEFADLADGYGTFLQMLSWIKTEFQNDPKSLLYHLADTSENCKTL